jgi:hypothetical protein
VGGALQCRGDATVCAVPLADESGAQHPHCPALTPADRSLEVIEQLDLDIAVAPLSERARESPYLAQHMALLFGREADRKHLECGTQAPRGDTHVVDAFRLPNREEPIAMIEHCARADGDDSPPRLHEWLVCPQADS